MKAISVAPTKSTVLRACPKHGTCRLPRATCIQAHAPQIHHASTKLPRKLVSREKIACRVFRNFAAVGSPWVCVAAKRRGHTLVIAASLVESSSSSPSVDSLLNQDLHANPELKIGFLDNGLRYVILPNPTPPSRFEAHLEVHAGSVHEGEAEQGIAHLVEHVTFLGSKKREGLLGTGARSNAYTDFHHTVFHVHSPHMNAATGAPLLPSVLDALTEIAFEPEFLPSRIEKERKAVIAEAQMMNTIEYRVDCQLLQYLHWENALGCRFPIGKTDQVLRWQRDEIMNFWGRHYFPSNATLYVVGDIDTVATEDLIRSTFGRIPSSDRVPASTSPEIDAEIVQNRPSNGRSGVLMDRLTHPATGRPMIQGPVEHQWGLHTIQRNAPVSIFRHRLLQLFQLSLFCKLPVQSVTRMDDLRRAFMVRVLLSVMQFRINARYVAADPPFIGIEFDHSDSGRESCAVSTLTITSEPRDWRGAVQVAVQEARRLQRYGVTPSELERYKAALLRDSEQLAEGSESLASLDNLEHVMESLALGHTVLSQKDAHAALVAVADTITVEEVNALARSLLSYISHFRNEGTLIADYEANPDAWASPGPTVATAIVACVPAFMDASGESLGGGAPMARGASMATTQHIGGDFVAAPSAEEEGSGGEEEVPEGAVRFDLTAEEIEAALAEEGLEVEAAADVDVPDALLSPDTVAELVATRKPAFVETGAPDSETGVLVRKLNNGIRVNYRHTDNEPRAAMVRVVAGGGRAAEVARVVGPTGHGSIAVGTRTLSESGTVGAWEREQVELFCISRLINCVLEATEEFICMDFHFAVGEEGLAAVLQLLHLFLESPRWEESAAERSKQLYLSHFRSLDKSLERATADKIMAAMTGDDRRFRDPSTAEIHALTLEGMKQMVMEQLHANNLEVSIVGDLDVEEVETAVLKYLGTVSPSPPDARAAVGGAAAAPECPVVQTPVPELRHQVWHLKDSDERACAFIAGPAPPRWGPPVGMEVSVAPAGSLPPPPPPPPFGQKPTALDDAARKLHPLYGSVTLGLLSEMINSRLFTTVRDTLGLTYDVSFELSLFDRLPTGWFHVNVTSTPAKINEAMMASLRVLRSAATQPFSERDLTRAKRTLLTRHESDLKDNAYWLSLLTHIQSDAVPAKRVECLRDLKVMYESVTVEDVYEAYRQFDFSDEAVFTCIGTSGRDAVLSKSPVLLEAEQRSQMVTPPPEVDPEAFMDALKAFMANMQKPSGGI